MEEQGGVNLPLRSRRGDGAVQEGGGTPPPISYSAKRQAEEFVCPKMAKSAVLGPF